jgi:hypothetical protein
VFIKHNFGNGKCAYSGALILSVIWILVIFSFRKSEEEKKKEIQLFLILQHQRCFDLADRELSPIIIIILHVNKFTFNNVSPKFLCIFCTS